MKYNVIITSSFERDAKPLLKRYKSLKEDLTGLIEYLRKNPLNEIPWGKIVTRYGFSLQAKGEGNQVEQD